MVSESNTSYPLGGKNVETEKTKTEIVQTGKVETEKVETEKVETDKVETDKVETDKVETEKVERFPWFNIRRHRKLDGRGRLFNKQL